jgi:hypothetical protein
VKLLVADLQMECCTTKRSMEVARKVVTKSAIVSPVTRAVTNGLGLTYKGSSPPPPLLNLVRFPWNISCASASEVSPLIPCRPLLRALSLDSLSCHLTSTLNLALVKVVTVLYELGAVKISLLAPEFGSVFGAFSSSPVIINHATSLR